MRAEAFWQCRGHSGRAAWIARLLFLVPRKRECTASATSEPEDGPIGCAMALGGETSQHRSNLQVRGSRAAGMRQVYSSKRRSLKGQTTQVFAFAKAHLHQARSEKPL